MGQAKQRGTFEQRQARAVELSNHIEAMRKSWEATQPKQKTSVTTTALVALGAGMVVQRNQRCKN